MREEICQLYEKADQQRKKEYDAAVTIQSWIRGLQTRHYIRHLHKSSIMIQKTWRGYMARSYFRIYVNNLHMMMRINFYHAMASRIQRMWRGFRVRKYQHNFYARQRYFDALAVKNQIVRYELDEWRQVLDQTAQQKEHEKRERELKKQARAQHYLLSTKQMPGVFYSYYGLSEMEKRLIENKPRVGERRKSQRKTVDKWDGCVEPPQPFQLQAPAELPPLDARKLQGPFREAEEIRKQRYKPLQPSIRVQTSYLSLQKARKILFDSEDAKRITDEPWRVAPKAHVRKEAMYELSLNASQKYNGRISETQFRHQDLSKSITNERFNTLVPPIPLFDRLNETYYQGQVKY